MVLHLPCGTLAMSLAPRGAHPLSGAMLVLAPFAIGLGPMALQWLTVDEDQPLRTDAALITSPLRPSARDVATVLLAGVHGFF